MRRSVTVIVALLAQVVLMTSPVCLVRCSQPDGHRGLEMIGRDCGCCAPASHGRHDHELAQDSELTDCHSRAGLEASCSAESDLGHRLGSLLSNVSSKDCACEHSLVETLPNLRAKAFSPPVDVSVSWNLDFSVETRSAALLSRAVRGFQFDLLRPQCDSHLDVLATKVLRV